MVLFALIAASSASGFSVVQSSIIGSALFFSAALSAIWKGRVVDRRGREVIIRQAQILAIAFATIFAAFLLAPWWTVALSAVFLGSIRFNPLALQQALWSEYHKNEQTLSRAMAWENIVSFVAQTAGPLLAALAVWFFGGYGALLVSGCVVVLSMGTWGALAPKGGAKKSASKKSVILSALPVVIALFTLTFAAGALQGILLHQEKGAILLAIYTAGAAAAGLYFFRRAFPEKLSTIALCVSPLLLALVAFSFQTPLLLPLLISAGALFSAGTLSANLQIKKLSPQSRLNEAFSLTLIAGPLGVSAGVFVSGLLLSGEWQLLAVGLSLILSLISWGALLSSGVFTRKSSKLATKKAQTA